MDDEKRQKFATTLERLRRKYIASLGIKADELEGAHSRVRAGDKPAERLLLQLIHRLAGTAGSFGVTDISHYAGALDERLQDPSRLSDERENIVALIALMRSRQERI